MLDKQKIVLKTLLLSKIFRFLYMKLCQFNKNLRKHQRKVNTAINTN